MFMNKTVTVSTYSDLMSGGNKDIRKVVKKSASPIMKGLSVIPLIVAGGKSAFACEPGTAIEATAQAIPAGAISGALTGKIIHAFDPLIELMVSISLPIAGVMLTGGALLIMIGQKDMGFRLIMNSAIGYVLVQMSPLFMDLLAGIGGAI